MILNVEIIGFEEKKINKTDGNSFFSNWMNLENNLLELLLIIVKVVLSQVFYGSDSDI